MDVQLWLLDAPRREKYPFEEREAQAEAGGSQVQPEKVGEDGLQMPFVWQRKHESEPQHPQKEQKMLKRAPRKQGKEIRAL